MVVGPTYQVKGTSLDSIQKDISLLQMQFLLMNDFFQY